MKAHVLALVVFCVLALACIELLIWLEPIGRHFTLAGHLLAQLGVLVFALPMPIAALADADVEVLWETRVQRRARVAAETAELAAREAAAIAERERSLGL